MDIFLDSYPASLLATPVRPGNPSQVVGIQNWARDCLCAGHQIILPEIVDYEVRRELIRSRKMTSIAELNEFQKDYIYLPLTTAAMLKAAELWALTRQKGQPTAHDENIDVDVILAAQALTSGILPANIIVATINVRHISRFVAAELWTNIKP